MTNKQNEIKSYFSRCYVKLTLVLNQSHRRNFMKINYFYYVLLSVLSFPSYIINSDTAPYTQLAEKEFSYLNKNKSANSLLILLPPPKDESFEFLNDQLLFEHGVISKGSSRWQNVISDANFSDDNIGIPFYEALSINISSTNTYILLKHISPDAGTW